MELVIFDRGQEWYKALQIMYLRVHTTNVARIDNPD
jgi:hypothetical protein